MTDLQTELKNCRDRWTKAKQKGDSGMMKLWDKVGNNLKRQIAERMGKPVETLFEKAEGIFKKEELK